ncbi:MAG: CoA transferase [Porticoccaceae bacterium]|nr:CoA transferase [Porticoccaceae bacterium]
MCIRDRYNIYETQDGKYIVLGASEMHFAINILTKMERTDLIEFCEPPPGPNQNPAKEFLTETFLSQSQAYWVEWFDGVDAAFAPVNDLRQAADDPQIRAREMIVEDEQGREHIGIPIKFSNEPGKIDFIAPELGAHNEEVALMLGYSKDQIQAMKADGVFGS